jgi:hypothetical protein
VGCSRRQAAHGEILPEKPPFEEGVRTISCALAVEHHTI